MFLYIKQFRPIWPSRRFGTNDLIRPYQHWQGMAIKRSEDKSALRKVASCVQPVIGLENAKDLRLIRLPVKYEWAGGIYLFRGPTQQLREAILLVKQ